VSTARAELAELAGREYAYGFSTDLDTDFAPRGLSEEVIRLISAKKSEPDWLLDWRLGAYRHWRTLAEPTWQNVAYPPIAYDDIIYYAAPKKKAALSSLDEVDP
jgi:Fe-S cluster assembly protein SufB